MKQFEVTKKTIGDAFFYIRPFPAFTAANLSGELGAIITPILGAIMPSIADKGVENLDTDDVVPALSSAMNNLSGDKIETLMKKLLIDHENVSVESDETEGRTVRLNEDLVNELFCGEVQNLYVLCWEVIKVNYGGFFKKLGNRFGGLTEKLQTVNPSTENTEN